MDAETARMIAALPPGLVDVPALDLFDALDAAGRRYVSVRDSTDPADQDAGRYFAGMVWTGQWIFGILKTNPLTGQTEQVTRAALSGLVPTAATYAMERDWIFAAGVLAFAGWALGIAEDDLPQKLGVRARTDA